MKYVLKTIQAGRLPLSSTVTASSGMAGVPLTLKASDSTRYLLTEVVTNTSPSRLRLKRQGNDLQITLPGGDAARPDIVIQDYYASTGVSLEGLASSGQVQAYDTAALAAGNSPGSAAGGEALAASSDSFSAQLGGGTDSSLSPLDHPWAIAGVVAGAGAIAALSRGSSESSSPSAAELALQTLRSFTNDSAAIGSKSASTPTLASYSALDLKTFKSLSGLTSLGLTGVTSANVDAIKAAITASSDNGTGVDTIAELQTMVSRVRIADYATSSSNVAPVLIDYQSFNSSAGASNLAAYNDAVNVKPSNVFTDTEISDLVTSYNTLLASADGNRLTTPTTAATALDYSHVGITVGSYAGTQATTLTLLNDVLSGLTSDKIDTVGELRTIEGVVGKILTMAANPKTSGASVADYVGLTQADLGLLGLRSNDGQLASSTNLTGAQVSYFNNQVIYSSNDGSAVDSFNELQLLLNNATIAA